MAVNSIDEKFMRKALSLAKLGVGKTKTNPLVGCVIVKNGKIIGRGYHKEFGGAHAEVFALKQAGRLAKGATLYVTLEPCCAFPGKKTPPCVNAVINAKVKRVVIAMKDPNAKVNGRSVDQLKSKGILVDVGILGEQSVQLNLPFIKLFTTHKPFVFLKVAMSLDSKIATPNQKYISSKESLKYVHKLRSQTDAILVGIGTVLKDDPSLTTRLHKGKDPLRVILDPQLSIPSTAKVLADKNVLIVHGKSGYRKEKEKLLTRRGFQLLPISQQNGEINWNELLLALPKFGISSLMVEGGSRIIASGFNSKIYDKCLFCIVPEYFGEGVPLLGSSLKHQVRLKILSQTSRGVDLWLEAQPRYA